MQAAAAPALTPVATPPATSTPPLNELEDVLYDLLATGIADPNLASHALDAVQVFLHEHARDRKTQAQFVAFFEQHGLNLRPERPNLLSLPALELRGRANETPLLEAPRAPEPPMEVELAAAISRKRVSPWMWVWAFAAVSCMTAIGVLALVELRAEFARVHIENAQLTTQLEQLRGELQHVRAEQTLTVQTLQRTERDTQLLLRAFASPLDLNSR